MAIETDSVMARLVKRVFPRMPDFYALLNGQCATVEEGLEALDSFDRLLELERSRALLHSS